MNLVLDQENWSARNPEDLNIEQFFAWAAKYAERFELKSGRPLLMSKAQFQHDHLKTLLVAQLLKKIDEDKFDLTSGKFALRTGPRSIRFPDIMLLPYSTDGKAIYADNPLMIIEFVSPSTASEDFGPKQAEYLALSSLQAYLIVAQDKVCAWLWLRGEDGFPEKPEVIEDLDATLTIAALDITLTLQAIYRGVAF